jgi:hypothetical protein
LVTTMPNPFSTLKTFLSICITKPIFDILMTTLLRGYKSICGSVPENPTPMEGEPCLASLAQHKVSRLQNFNISIYLACFCKSPSDSCNSGIDKAILKVIRDGS